MTDPLHERLVALHTQNQPDSEFADRLEVELRTAAQTLQITEINFKAIRRTRLYRRVAAIAASVVIVAGLFATVPPLRSFAEDVMNYFVPGTYTHPTEEQLADAAARVVIVETVAEAEAIVGFDVLEWTDERYKVSSINAMASPQSVNVMYATQWHSTKYMTLSQHVAGSLGDETSEAVGDEADIQAVRVNGVQGEYVRGIWYYEVIDGEEGPVEWRTDMTRQLRWQKDNIVYRISVSKEIADTPEQVVALAESLR